DWRVWGVVVAGCARGARRARWCAVHRERESPAGVIAVVGTPAVDEVADLLPAAAELGLRVWFLTGDRDFAAPAVRAAHAAFEAAGIECRLTESTGVGHAFPDGFDDLLPGMPGFVLGSAEGDPPRAPGSISRPARRPPPPGPGRSASKPSGR